MFIPAPATCRRLLKAGYLKRGDTLETLASASRHRRARGCAGQSTRNNGYAKTGVDPDFGKGETELNRFNGDDAHKPNPCIGPIETAPYYGLEIWPAEIAVSDRPVDGCGRARAEHMVAGRSTASTRAATTWRR